MNFQTALDQYFHHAIRESDFVARSAAVLGTHGFTPESL
jgi:hypothetical protein